MPLTKIEKVTANRYIGIWKIEETEEEFLEVIPEKNSALNILKQFKSLVKRLEWLAARHTVQKLCPELGIEYQGIDKNPEGKPLLINSKAEISLSHSYPYVCAIIDKELEVGIDVEQPKEKIKKIAYKFLSDEELVYCNGCLTMQCILWSAKEAMYKIYAKKGLTFKKHLIIDPFELSSSGTIDGLISIDDYQKRVKLQYQVAPDHIIVYNQN